MKFAADAILRPEQAQYLDSLLPPRDPVALAIEADAHAYDVPIVDPEVGHFLFVAAKSMNAQRILEIGTATGYSGLWLARALGAGGRLITIDVDAERQQTARQSWTDAGVAERVETLLGPALEVIPTLSGPFDLLFLDAIKTEYQGYLDLALPLLRPGAVVIADNTLRAGKVALLEDEPYTNAVRDFNRYAMQHPRLTSVMLPLGDGLLYALVNA